MDVLQTPDSRFENLPGYPFAPHYVDVTAADTQPVRMHYVDEGPSDGSGSCCCTASRRGVTCIAP